MPVLRFNLSRALVWLCLAALPVLSAQADQVIRIDKEFHNPRHFARLGDIIVFEAMANTISETMQLWRTDGTHAGTTCIMDFPHTIYEMKTVGRQVFIACSDGLWKSDGTVGGTVFLKPLKLAWTSGYMGTPLLSKAGNKLCFLVDYTGPFVSTVKELWVSDGTPSGTLLLMGLPANPDLASVETLGPEINGRMLFDYRDESNIHHLYSTDGTPAGTTALKTMRWEDVSPFLGSRSWAIMNGMLYFAENGAIVRTDGTPAGTGPAYQPSGDNLLTRLMGAENQPYLLHICITGNVDRQAKLYSLSGTPLRSQLLGYAIDPPNSNCFHISVGSKIVFLNQQHLAISDGTSSGTFNLDNWPTPKKYIGDQKALSDRLFFATQDDDQLDVQGWMSDGTVAGTRKIMTLEPAVFHPSGDYFMGALNGRVVIKATDRQTMRTAGTLFVVQGALPNAAQVWQQYP